MTSSLRAFLLHKCTSCNDKKEKKRNVKIRLQKLIATTEAALGLDLPRYLSSAKVSKREKRKNGRLVKGRKVDVEVNLTIPWIPK